jgi:hypothetical protein
MSNKESRERLLRGLVLFAVALGCLGGIGWAIKTAIQDSNEQDSPRHEFVTQRSEEIKQLTHGGIVVTEQLYFIDGKQGVEFTLGNCQQLSGYFETPERPTRLDDVSPLYISAPLRRDKYQKVTERLLVKLTDKNLGAILKDTLLNACVAGDPRFAS